jgi:hypothetical protein
MKALVVNQLVTPESPAKPLTGPDDSIALPALAAGASLRVQDRRSGAKGLVMVDVPQRPSGSHPPEQRQVESSSRPGDAALLEQLGSIVPESEAAKQDRLHWF